MNPLLAWVLLILLVFACGQQLTINNQNQGSNNSPKPLTYRLISDDLTFKLPLQVAGFNYSPQIDSGSSDFFIKGENTPGVPAVKYSCPVCISINPKYKVDYAVSLVQVYVQQLPVTLGGRTFNASVQVAYIATNIQENQGIIGLSYQSSAQNPNPTFLQTLININMISSYSYGVNLNSKSFTTSYITFGSYDPRFFSGNLHYASTTSRSDCFVGIESVSIGSEALSFNQGLVDTGSLQFLFNPRVEKSILSSFSSQFNQCYFHHLDTGSLLYCKVGRFNDLPRIRIVINGKTFQIEKEVYLLSCSRHPDEGTDDTNVNTGNWYCSTAIRLQPGQQFVMGAVFMNRYYTYFDLQNDRIGFARNYQTYSLNMVINKYSFDWQAWNQLL